MLSCHSCYIYLLDLEEQRGRGFKVVIWREGKRPQTRGTLMGRHKKTSHREMTTDTELLYLELPAYFSLLWCKKIYAIHKIPSY